VPRVAMVLEHEYTCTPDSSTPSTRVPVDASCGVVLARSWRLRVYCPGEKTLKSRFEQSITSEIQEGDELLRIVVLACCKDGLDNALCNAIIARYSRVRTSTPVLVCVFSVVCGYARVHGTTTVQPPQRLLVLGQPYNPCTASPVNVESDMNVI
jgi:hypothetical protein